MTKIKDILSLCNISDLNDIWRNDLKKIKIQKDKIIGFNRYFGLILKTETKVKKAYYVESSNIKKNFKISNSEVDISYKKGNVIIEDCSGVKTLIENEKDVDYPNVEKIYPKGKEKAKITLNPKYLLKLLKCFSEDREVEIKIHDNYHVTLETENKKGLIIGIKVE